MSELYKRCLTIVSVGGNVIPTVAGSAVACCVLDAHIFSRVDRIQLSLSRPRHIRISVISLYITP